MGEGGGEDAISGSGWWVKLRKGGANGRDATNPGPLPAPSTCLGLIDRRSPQQQNWLETRTRKPESSEFFRHPIGTSPVQYSPSETMCAVVFVVEEGGSERC